MPVAARAIQKPTLDGVHLRDGTEADLSFVRATMQKELTRLWPYRSPCDEKLLFHRLVQVLPKLLSRSDLRMADVNGAIAAFAIIDRHAPLVHWVHTAVPYRRQGLARVLLSTLSKGWRASHDTSHGANLLKALGGVFDPYALYMEASDGEV